MSTVTVTDKKYTVDPLFQWDQGQVLEIRGLSLAKAPEIHFDNGCLSGCVVKQATMDNAGIINVNIPNILLEKPHKITAYVCDCGEEEFKSLYSFEIPVKPRKKPEFYEVVDEYEIYSIEALKTEVEIELQKILDTYNLVDTSVENAKTSELNAKASEDKAKESELNAKASEENTKTIEERAREVFESIPEDYSTISNDLYELAIKETAIGEEIRVNDSSNLKLREFALFGKARQNTTLGNQLFDFIKGIDKENKGVKVKDNGDGTLSITGLATASDGVFVLGNSYTGTNVVLSLKAGTYYVSGLPNGLKFYLYKANTEKADAVYKNADGTFTLDTDTDFTSVSARWGVDTEFNSLITKIMMNSGTTALPWEPFTNGASPNPQYPQPIEVSGASGSVEVKSQGKNYVSDDWEQGLLSVENGTSINSNGYWIHTNKYIEVDSTKRYTISSDTTNSFTIYFYDKNKSFLSTLQPLRYAETPSKTITISEKAKYVRFGYNYNGSAEAITPEQMGVLHWLQLEEGEVGTPYQPYEETLATIPTENGLAGIKVSSGGNYTDQNGQQWVCDEIVKYADGSGEYIQRIKKVVFDGVNLAFNTKSSSTKNNIFLADNKTRDLKKPPTNTDYASFVSSHFVIDMNDGSNAHGYGSSKPCMYGDYRYPNIYFGFGIDTEITSIELANEWLKSNNVTVYYELAEPIRTPLTAEEIAEIEKLHTFYPITNISNDFDCGMSMKYNADSKNYIDKKIAEMFSAMNN